MDWNQPNHIFLLCCQLSTLFSSFLRNDFYYENDSIIYWRKATSHKKRRQLFGQLVLCTYIWLLSFSFSLQFLQPPAMWYVTDWPWNIFFPRMYILKMLLYFLESTTSIKLFKKRPRVSCVFNLVQRLGFFHLIIARSLAISGEEEAKVMRASS